jgi:hypothetical protein
MSTKQLTERFGQSGLVGGKAEEYAYSQLLNAYDSVIDLREDREAQYRGIDFSIKQKKWKHAYSLDVKGNLHNGMFYLEFFKGNRPGWFHTSTSHRIYHVDVEEGKVAWYGLPEMRMRLLDEETLTGYSSGLKRIAVNDNTLQDLIRTTW